MSTVSIVFTSSESLPSQYGVRGRPRARGRATVVGEGLPLAATQRALAALYEVKPSQLTPYARESGDGRLTFVVPGLDKDERQLFAGTLVEDDVPMASDEAPAASDASDAA